MHKKAPCFRRPLPTSPKIRRLSKDAGRFGLLALLLFMGLQSCGGRAKDRGSGEDSGGDGEHDDGGTGSHESTTGASGGADLVGDASGGSDSGSGGSSSGGGSSLGGGTGGTSGSSTGGQGAGGQGTGGTGPLLVPEGCEPKVFVEDESRCSMNVDCGDRNRGVECRKLESGEWECSCIPLGHLLPYELGGVSGSQACAAASWLCFDEPELEEEKCELKNHAVGASRCEAALVCGQEVGSELPSGVEASLVQRTNVRCEASGDGLSFDCFCQNSEEEFTARIEDIADLCEPFVEFCRAPSIPGELPIEFCSEDFMQSSDMGCEMSGSCTQMWNFTGDIQLGVTKPKHAVCDPTDGSAMRCSCGDQNSTFSFRVEEQLKSEQCEAVIADCSDDSNIQDIGQPVCAPSSQSSGVDFCEADLDCSVPALLDATPILADARLLVYCVEADDESWYCSCASDQTTATFEFGSTDLSPFQVCSSAPAKCLEEMPVKVGAYGEFMPAPYPLPL